HSGCLPQPRGHRGVSPTEMGATGSASAVSCPRLADRSSCFLSSDFGTSVSLEKELIRVAGVETTKVSETGVTVGPRQVTRHTDMTRDACSGAGCYSLQRLNCKPRTKFGTGGASGTQATVARNNMRTYTPAALGVFCSL